MKVISFPSSRLVLVFFAMFYVVGCSGGVAEDTELGAGATRPADRADSAPPSHITVSTAEQPEGSFTDAMVQEGQQIFVGAGICATCHGPGGTGVIGPDLTDAEWLIGDGEYDQLVAQISEGVSAAEATNPLGAIMPPKGGSAITETQVRSVAAYVWMLSH